MPYGFAGQILHVNLTTGALTVEEPTDEFYHRYRGGSAMGLYYLLKNTPSGADPLGPENTLAITIAGLTGAPISGQSRATAVAKSPLTGGVGDSQAGGFWPAELKFAGFDGIIVTGRAATPVYLWIKEGVAELRPADHLWGKTTRQVEAELAEELGDHRIHVAQIGPSGEKLVKFVAIMNMANRAHGRTGMGAVMGSKNLKAIVVRGGKKRLNMANPEALRVLMQQGRVASVEDEDMTDFGKLGTIGIVNSQNAAGGLPTRNWQSGFLGYDEAEAISGETLYDTWLRGAEAGTQFKDGRDTCYSCSVKCKRVVEAEWEGKALHPDSGGPEYETASVFGSYCGATDMGAIIYANQLCNDHGVDTISAGATIAFAMECFERGLITAEDTGGIDLTFGNAKAMIEMLELMLAREGFGDVLAEGSAAAAERIGKGASDYAIVGHRQEFPAHMPQKKPSLALIYAVNPFGADHQSSEHDPAYTPRALEASPDKYGKRMTDIGLTTPVSSRDLNREKVEFALKTQYVYSAMDTVNVCQFVYGPSWQLLGTEELAEAITAVTGDPTTVDDLLEVGARRLNLLRAFNAREGMTREQDTLPKRLFDEPLSGGRSDGVAVDRALFDEAIEMYYDMAGWDPVTGNPTRETLEGLELGWVADELQLA